MSASMLDHALFYSTLGWRVIPLEHRQKKPLTSNWTLNASRDWNVIKHWWTESGWDEPNIGLLCGDSFDVLDIDGSEGWETVKRAVRGGPYGHAGPVVKTASGFHLHFEPTGLDKCKPFGPNGKVDYQARGAQAVAPPSIHPSGVRYEWIRDPVKHRLPEMPEWLMTHLTRATASPTHETRGPTLGTLAGTRPTWQFVAEQLGLELRDCGDHFKINCLYHPDQTPSLALYKDLRTFTCFGCDARGDSHDLLAGTRLGESPFRGRNSDYHRHG